MLQWIVFATRNIKALVQDIQMSSTNGLFCKNDKKLCYCKKTARRYHYFEMRHRASRSLYAIAELLVFVCGSAKLTVMP